MCNPEIIGSMKKKEKFISKKGDKIKQKTVKMITFNR